MTKLSAQEIADLVPCSLADVRRLEDLGILEQADGDGRHPSSDVHVVRLMGAFEDAGISLEDVARGMKSGELQFPMGLFMPEPVGQPETYEALAARLGREPDLVRRISREVGLSPPADDRLRAEDAEHLALILTTLDLADDEELSRFARLYGGTVQRLVTSGLQFFDRAVRQRVATFDVSDSEKDALVFQRAPTYTVLVQSLVSWLQRRHREHAVLEYLVGVAEDSMEERGISPRPPKQPPAIAFLDLTGYTRLAEERGDEAAAAVASDLATVVQATATMHGGRPVKWLGDGVMFHFDDPAGAIRSGIELVEQTERATTMPARIGINAGAVIVQEGDYFGRTVNVAARIADYAGPRDVIVSDEAKRNASVTDVSFEPLGEIPLKGVLKAVRLHRATRA